MLANCDVIVFFQFMVNLLPSGSQIMGAWFLKHTFPIKVTFCVTKTENRTKKSLTQFLYHFWAQFP